MDRTVIDTWKAEEKEFGEKLHTKLTALMSMIHPPTEEFKKCFVQDMFLKPNQKAFFHVMHYLFTLLDPVEFKKRFYWPIADKKSEANFRSSTIQYLMQLNEKHNLQWANIKSYLVVMPGGMKFIIFLLDFIDFIVTELIKQREKSVLGDMTREHFSEFTIDRMRAQNKIHKEYASRYIKAIDHQIVILKDNTENLRKHISCISIPNLDIISDLLDDSVLSSFAASNRQLFKSNLQEKVAKVATIEEPLKGLKEKLDRFQNHEAGVKYDREMVKRSLLKIKLLYPDLDVGQLMHGSELQMETLLNAFNLIYPDLELNIKAVNQQSNRNVFIGKELCTLKTDILQVETQVTKFLSSISGEFKNPKTKITPVRRSLMAQGGSSMLFSKFINTPPIKLDMIDNKMSNNPRIPFLDDFAVERSIESFCYINQQNNLFPSMTAPGSTKKSHDTSMKHNQSTIAKSKIVDPLKLLRTLNKDTSKSRNTSRNLSSLASKWKKHESLFGQEDGDSSQIDGCTTMVSMAVDSPFGSNEKTAVSLYQLDTSITAPSGISDSNLLFPRKISAVKKVQDASLNFQNLSTSPSGRLDPLVLFDPKEFPKILLNDRTIFETSLSNKIDFLDVFNADKSSLVHEDINRSFISKNSAPGAKENDLNASNIDFSFKEKDQNVSSDAIFDISDGVLKDVTM